MMASVWESIADAYKLVQSGGAKRIDGAGWSVYAVGSNVIRVDIRQAAS